ncbi:TetR/AcrR family transcriptional regulator [Breoghania sp.]|uniref:TetR/AcrR family transcriptional regulator n=1 Tax=Breoghania sp. TaxID=2065378 RepID=UPI002622A258|nr:TetR/AcrR family transcriptional regulator [Breoghania sp.]MDJ0931511.1 TetR/AcrR family transcriptional regulator [Breoghania sp.]
MRSADEKDRRMLEIEEAAYALLSEVGCKATSMLAIAKRAKASNETLYRWYGNKQGLFARMVERNAEASIKALETALQSGRPIGDVLDELGPALLQLVVGERAVALNRAAAGDVHDSGQLGRLIAEGGRARVEKLLAQVLGRYESLTCPAETIAASYLDLLIGDIQVRRIIGAADIPDESWIRERSDRAKRIAVLLMETGMQAPRARG